MSQQRCPNCQHQNPSEAVFCMNCGAKLTRTCTNCGTALPPAARFCMNCGQPVVTSTPMDEDRQAKLAAATPAPLADKMRAAHVEGERKLVTTLFADVVGSTALAERMDPEEWTAIMNRAFEHLSPAIHRYEGTIARLMGDALLAFFGAPVAHEDDPVRAIRAALDLLAAAREYAEEVRRTYGIEFAVRVGMSTGMVVVGAVGSDLKYEYTAMGDAVNLAARMQSAADPGTVLIADNTYRLAAPFFECEDRGQITVKGKAEPVQVYRVISERTGTVQARGIEGLSSPLVGRNQERQTLMAALAEVAEGRGQMVSVMGEAGLGKSRLVAEVRKTSLAGINGRPSVRWLEGRSLSYEIATPYAPFVDMLSTFFGMRSLSDNAEKYARLKTAISEVMGQRASEAAPFIATLIGVEPTGDDSQRVRYLEPPQLRGKIFQAVGEWIRLLAAKQPTVLVFEDLHWADPTSLDLIEALMPLTEQSALLILMLFRPRRNEPSWRIHEAASRDFAHRYTPVALQPLDEAQSRELVANLLEIEDLPESVRALILTKAEGNPFFVEEVIRSLLDAGLVVREDGHWRATREIAHIAVPDNLAAVITARLDRLDEGVKRTAQTASVIGREFDYAVLADISEASQTLDNALGTLQHRELVREKSRMPSRTYAFKHVLVQETAYGSLLLSRRRELHRRVAECLERMESERAGEIAWHYLEAREPIRSLPYLLEAANRAARAFSVKEAIGYYTQALDILQAADDARLRQQVYEGLAQIRLFSGDIPAAIDTYQTMLQYGEAHADIPIQVSALNKLARLQMFQGRLDQMEAPLLRAEQLARQYQDKAGLAEMFTIRCAVYNFVGDFDTGFQYMDEAAQVGKELNIQAQIVFGLTHTALMLTGMTRFDEAESVAEEAAQAIEATGHLGHKAELLTFVRVVNHLRRGDLAAAFGAVQEGQAIAQKIGQLYVESSAALMLGIIARWQGEYEQAIRHLERAQQLGHIVGLPFLEIYALGALGAVYRDISPAFTEQADQYHTQALAMMEGPMGYVAGGLTWADIGYCMLANGDVSAAHDLFERGITRTTPQGLLNRPKFLIGLACVAIAQKDLEGAAQHVDDARRYAVQRSMKHFYPEIDLVEGRVYAARGQSERALNLFAQAESGAEAMTMRPLVWQARAEAAKVLSSLGRQAEAEAQHRAAQAMLDEMAGKITDETLRSQFLESALERLGQL
jgi:class 3 adenylate cyclase/tetratricopeptide (TPR) repeat protein